MFTKKFTYSLKYEEVNEPLTCKINITLKI